MKAILLLLNKQKIMFGFLAIRKRREKTTLIACLVKWTIHKTFSLEQDFTSNFFEEMELG